MAADALCRCPGKPVVDVALTARSTCVRSRQGKLRGSIMVELRPLPLCRRVAQGTILREVCGDVAWIRGLGEVDHVAACAIRRRAFKDIVDVTLSAGKVDVRPRQGEFGRGIVIELGALPLHGSVTERAIVWEAGSGMIWIARLVEIGHVAALTFGGRSLE